MPWREAREHILNQGLHYASSVFEGERAYEGRIFRSVDHTRRLLHSAKRLEMDVKFSVEQIEAAKKAEKLSQVEAERSAKKGQIAKERAAKKAADVAIREARRAASEEKRLLKWRLRLC